MNILLYTVTKRGEKTGKKSLWKNSLYFTQIRHYRQYFPCCRVKDDSECDVNKLSWPDLQKRICFLYWTFLVWRMLEIIVKQTCVYLHRYMFRLHRSTIHLWILKMNDKTCWERTFPFTHTKQFIKQFIYIISAEFVTVCSKSFIDYVCFYKR